MKPTSAFRYAKSDNQQGESPWQITMNPTAEEEEDFYGNSTSPYILPLEIPIDPVTYICKDPLSAASVASFWRWRLRSDDCCTTGEATITANDYSTCRIEPTSAVSRIILWGDGEYEFTPELPKTNIDHALTLTFSLGHRSCTPRPFGIVCPFRIRQSAKFYYISQGLDTEVVNRSDFSKSDYETRAKLPLTLTFSGMAFHVKLVKST